MDLHYRDGIVIEDGRDIFRGEFVGRVADEQARLTDSTVTDDDTPVATIGRVSMRLDNCDYRSWCPLAQHSGGLHIVKCYSTSTKSTENSVEEVRKAAGQYLRQRHQARSLRNETPRGDDGDRKDGGWNRVTDLIVATTILILQALLGRSRLCRVQQRCRRSSR